MYLYQYLSDVKAVKYKLEKACSKVTLNRFRKQFFIEQSKSMVFSGQAIPRYELGVLNFHFTEYGMSMYKESC